MKDDEKIENQPVAAEEVAEKDAIREYLKSRYPDAKTEDDSDYLQRITDDFSKYDETTKSRNELNELLSKDPRISGMLSGMSSGLKEDGSPFSISEYLIANYGDEISGSMDKEEVAKKAAEKEASMVAEQAEADKRNKAREENIEVCDKALEEAIKEGKYSDDDARSFLEWLYDPETGFIHRVMIYDIKKEDWIKLLRIFNYDSDVDKAEKSGYKRGRNENIDITRHKGSSRQNMPKDLSGSSLSLEANEKDPTLNAYSKMKPRV